MRPSSLAPHFCQATGQYEAIHSLLFFQTQGVGPTTGEKQKARRPTAAFSPLVLSNIAPAEFPPATGTTQLDAKIRSRHQPEGHALPQPNLPEALNGGAACPLSWSEL